MQAVKTGIRIQKVAQSRVSEVDWENLPFGRIFSDHMLTAYYKDGEWQTPEIVPFGKLALAPSVTSLNYGQSIFEGMKASLGPKGEALLFRPEENYKRMNRSAYRMCMPEIPESIFMEGLKTLVDLDREWIPAADKGSLYLRPLYFGTDEYIGVRASSSYLFTVFTCPVGAYYSKPVKLLASREYVRAAPGGTGAAKCAGNYAASLFPDRIAKERGYDNVLWLDAKENTYVEECGTMNLFFVIDGTVVTSPLTGTILPGITRDSVLQLLKAKGEKVEVRPISIFEVESAYDQGKLEEAFGVGTAAVISHIDQIGFAGRDWHLPAIDQRPVSNWLKTELEGIKSGEKADPYGWMVKV